MSNLFDLHFLPQRKLETKVDIKRGRYTRNFLCLVCLTQENNAAFIGLKEARTPRSITLHPRYIIEPISTVVSLKFSFLTCELSVPFLSLYCDQSYVLSPSYSLTKYVEVRVTYLFSRFFKYLFFICTFTHNKTCQICAHRYGLLECGGRQSTISYFCLLK